MDFWLHCRKGSGKTKQRRKTHKHTSKSRDVQSIGVRSIKQVAAVAVEATAVVAVVVWEAVMGGAPIAVVVLVTVLVPVIGWGSALPLVLVAHIIPPVFEVLLDVSSSAGSLGGACGNGSLRYIGCPHSFRGIGFVNEFSCAVHPARSCRRTLRPTGCLRPQGTDASGCNAAGALSRTAAGGTITFFEGSDSAAHDVPHGAPACVPTGSPRCGRRRPGSKCG